MRQVVAMLVLMVGVTVALVGAAADVTGRWRGAAASGTDITLELKADGAKVTGTASLNGAEPRAISDGRFEDGRLSFTMPSMYGQGTVAVNGTLNGDELALSLESERGKTTATLKRQH